MKISLIGHIFFQSGRGEDIRTFANCLIYHGYDINIINFHEPKSSDDNYQIYKKYINNEYSDINIFFLNGNEIDMFKKKINLKKDQINIIFPAWELENFPNKWASLLDQFDAIFVSSEFQKKSLEKNCKPKVFLQKFPIVPMVKSLKLKSNYKMPSGYFIIFSSFDLQSYIERKNILSMLRVFERFVLKYPDEKIKFFLKAKKGNEGISTNELGTNNELLDILKRLEDKVIFYSNVCSNNDIMNIIYLSDMYISLHRSEGFGRVIAESMYFEKPVLVTSYSGNMDFCTKDNAALVKYDFIDVKKEDYIDYKGQKWANPNEDDALEKLEKIYFDPKYRHKLGKNGRKQIVTNYSFAKVYQKLLENISLVKKNKKSK